MCCVWESLVLVLGSECVLCVGEFGVCLGERVCGVCGRVWCGFGGVSVCCVWESFMWICGSEIVLCLGDIVWVWGSECLLVNERSVWIWGSEYVLCAKKYGVGLG